MNQEQEQNANPNPNNNQTGTHLNIDGIQRNAGRDYYELIAISSIKTLLTCAPKAQLALKILETERQRSEDF
ncbi:hypothetical protein [Methylomonas fluvii]|nr:hypothetical protein [Methylomonas fluvii]